MSQPSTWTRCDGAYSEQIPGLDIGHISQAEKIDDRSCGGLRLQLGQARRAPGWRGFLLWQRTHSLQSCTDQASGMEYHLSKRLN